eukprot:GFYU01000882.1.p1 GENE.GFYU01000882.1~~GFYU01000882.1.p1  ORF type:complete len:498 (-),score=111.93 GFYU01000882.1:105-1598(-)
MYLPLSTRIQRVACNARRIHESVSRLRVRHPSLHTRLLHNPVHSAAARTLPQGTLSAVIEPQSASRNHLGGQRHRSAMVASVDEVDGDCAMNPLITRKGSNDLRVRWSDGTESVFHHIWLRDHCRCPECYHAGTQQRLLDTYEIPLDIQPETVRVVRAEDAKYTDAVSQSTEWLLQLTWPDGHVTEYPAQWLQQRCDARAPAPATRTLWTAQDMSGRMEEMGQRYEDVVGDSQAFRNWLENIDEYGFALMKDAPTSSKQIIGDLGSRIGEKRVTMYGSVEEDMAIMELEVRPDSDNDTAYSSIRLETHTDGTYWEDQPGLFIFHCFQAAPEGGETLLVDAFKAAETLQRTDPEAFNLLANVHVKQQFIDNNNFLVAKRSLFTFDDDDRLSMVTFNMNDRAPLDLPQDLIVPYYNALKKWCDIVRDPSMELNVLLQPGDVLVLNNRRVMHGRNEFTLSPSQERYMTCMYLNIDALDSRIRFLRRQQALSVAGEHPLWT